MPATINVWPRCDSEIDLLQWVAFAEDLVYLYHVLQRLLRGAVHQRAGGQWSFRAFVLVQHVQQGDGPAGAFGDVRRIGEGRISGGGEVGRAEDVAHGAGHARK
ncbi:MAG: hypothetical protein QM724_10775 [Flavobacteriales bacterium]